jgi:hypothetical protein
LIEESKARRNIVRARSEDLCLRYKKNSIKNITRYGTKVNKKVVAYQAIVGYIERHREIIITS